MAVLKRINLPDIADNMFVNLVLLAIDSKTRTLNPSANQKHGMKSLAKIKIGNRVEGRSMLLVFI